MKYILTALLLLLTSAQALANKKEIKSDSVVVSLEQSRLELASGLTSDQQPEKFDKALLALCDSFKSTEAKASRPSAEYLKQMLLLADRLLVIDPGKNAMDCFGPYYSRNTTKVNTQLNSMDTSLQDRLKYELELAYKSVNNKEK